jgi:acyl carrier protein
VIGIRAISVSIVLILTHADKSFAHFRLESMLPDRQDCLVFVQSNDVSGRITAIIAEHLKSSSEMNSATTLESLGADDLDMVELMLKFETEFGIIIPDERAEKVKTIADVTRLVEELTAAIQ